VSSTVSTVIATRDRPEMVREAIAAVWAQDHPGPVEVVVVFDQSEADDSLARSEGNRSTRVITNSHSPGLAGARNTGIEAATGEYVAFCDDDDYWLPGRLSRQLGALEAAPEAGLATCGIRVEYGGETFERALPGRSVSFEELLRDRHTELHPSTFLLRRSVLLERIGLVDEEVPGGFGEDYEFLLRCARQHPVVNVPEPLVVVRWGGQSFFFQRWQTMSAGLAWLLDRYPEFERVPRGSARVHGQIAFAQAAMGERRTAARWVGRTFRRNPREPRLYLAVAVASGLVSPARVMSTLHRRGRGI
jgi:glycosyltransferase involved in cell wall biosynthesis